MNFGHIIKEVGSYIEIAFGGNTFGCCIPAAFCVFTCFHD